MAMLRRWFPSSGSRDSRCHMQGMSGQATVEFVVVGSVVLVVAAALAALWHLVADGSVLAHASRVASHVPSFDLGAVGDVLLY